jgi:hypothetical protein
MITSLVSVIKKKEKWNPSGLRQGGLQKKKNKVSSPRQRNADRGFFI